MIRFPVEKNPSPPVTVRPDVFEHPGDLLRHVA
jgi:hypothetical protein